MPPAYAPVHLPANFSQLDAATTQAWIEAWVASVVVVPTPSPELSGSSDATLTNHLVDRPGFVEWEARAMAGVKRMYEDEAYRLSLTHGSPEVPDA